MVAPRARALRLGLLCALVVLCLVSVLAPLSAYVRQQSELASLTAEVEAARTRVAELSTSVQRWDDPAYVSAQARARLRYQLPGETAYAVLDAGVEQAGAAGTASATSAGPDAGPVAGPVAGASADRGAWYSGLWGSFQAAGQP